MRTGERFLFFYFGTRLNAGAPSWRNGAVMLASERVGLVLPLDVNEEAECTARLGLRCETGSPVELPRRTADVPCADATRLLPTMGLLTKGS